MAVGRFQVMAMLQAARAHELGLPMDSALSWGLNRAIFYAAAKRGFKGNTSKEGVAASQRSKSRPAPNEYHLGDELAFTRTGTRKMYFEIGGKTQTEKDFERQIASRFNGKFDSAWDDALDYVRMFDRETLLSGQTFFASVYRPKRDELAAKWSAMTEDSKGTSEPTTRKRPH
jgi:hypothetical protein